MKKNSFIVFFNVIFAVLMLTNLVACLKSDIVFFGGSNSISPLFHLLLNGFENEENQGENDSFIGFNEAYNRKVIYLHNGSSAGEEGVKNQSLKMGFTSRQVREEFLKNDKYVVFNFAIDKMIIFTKAPKGCEDFLNITIENKKYLKKLFLATEEVITWRNLLGDKCANDGRLIGINREAGSGTRDMWRNFLEFEENDKFANSLHIANSNSLMINKVSSIENSIGYISFSSLDSIIANKLDVFKINGQLADSEKYDNKLSRSFNALFLRDIISEGIIQDFITFLFDPKKGQLALEKLKLVKVAKPNWLKENKKW